MNDWFLSFSPLSRWLISPQPTGPSMFDRFLGFFNCFSGKWTCLHDNQFTGKKKKSLNPFIILAFTFFPCPHKPNNNFLPLSLVLIRINADKLFLSASVCPMCFRSNFRLPFFPSLSSHSHSTTLMTCEAFPFIFIPFMAFFRASLGQ